MEKLKTPDWATISDEPKPGEALYVRPIGSVMAGGSGAELKLSVVQWNDAEPCIKIDETWLTLNEAELLTQMVATARKVITPKHPFLRAVG